MISEPSEATIDQIVATCNGDLRGALKALLLVNEQLEAALARCQTASVEGPSMHGTMGNGSRFLH